jgi:4,5-dihydroxyphthalate decarboxylase
MSRLRLTLSCWDYDRVAALADGRVAVEGVDLNFLAQPVEETFFPDAAAPRVRRRRDVALVVHGLAVARAAPVRGHPRLPLALLPPLEHLRVREERHPRCHGPCGKRVGTPEYQMTAPVWIRGMLADEFGVRAEDVEHLTGGEEQPGREEKLKLDLPARIRVRRIGPDQTLAAMIADGGIDALFTARAPSTFRSRPDAVRRLFEDYVAVERDYFRRTKIFPIMHTVVIRREVYEANPWLAQSLFKAFVEAQRLTYRGLGETAAHKAMLPWLTHAVEEARRELGEDWWPYGFAPTGTCSTPSCATTTSRGCRRGGSRPRRCSRPRRSRAS